MNNDAERNDDAEVLDEFEVDTLLAKTRPRAGSR